MEDVLALGNLRFRYKLEGHGPWLVLLHGVGGSLEQWDAFIEALGGRYRTLRFDQRGRGQSSKPPGPYSNEDFVADLKGMVDAVIDPEESFALVGNSLGAIVAQGFALVYPDRLSKLVLLAGVAGRTEAEKAAVAKRLAVVEGGVAGAHFEQSMDRWFTDTFREANPDTIAYWAERNRANDPQGYAAAYYVLANTDLIDRLHEIVIPTLIATGEEDRGSNPRMSRAMHECIKGSRLHIFPGLRHQLLIEAPEAVAGLVDGFLRS
ncbi:MAG: alpha/beta fold hydrolase [Azospirillaceae bacterium]